MGGGGFLKHSNIKHKDETIDDFVHRYNSDNNMKRHPEKLTHIRQVIVLNPQKAFSAAGDGSIENMQPK